MIRQSWGRLPILEPALHIERDWRSESLVEFCEQQTLLPVGMGRSYGDSCINSGASALSTRCLNRFIQFDSERGLLECEAGLTLEEILQVIVPRGWFLPVVPGTQFVTLGGAIANDVHGKNHHGAGSFGCHVESFRLLRSNGDRLNCSSDENEALFAATIGGLGLTGLILSARISLMPISSCKLESQNIAFSGVEEFVSLSQESNDWEYSVAWVDTIARKGRVGRGVFSRARHSQLDEDLSPSTPGFRLGMPASPPFSLVNRWTVDGFNRLYYSMKSRKTRLEYSPYSSFLFPLDAISHWNRIYGSRGFYQYQCLVPEHAGEKIQEMLEAVNASGEGSFLTVLKVFGQRRSPGMMSFPRPGITLAMDFPNRGPRTIQLMNKLDEIVMEVGGALYPAKDARMSATLFSSGFPGLDTFKPHVDPNFSSAFWRRVQA